MIGSSCLVPALVLFLAATSAHAQNADPELLRLDSLVASGELADARTRLAAWLDVNPPGAVGPGRGSQAHALFLKGRLATDWVAAEDAYLSVVLGYPTSEQAPPALLLLGQGLLAAANARTPSTAAIRAVSYLERLSNDYPGHPLHDEARIWLARAHAQAGFPERGCSVLRLTLTGTVDSGTARAIRTEIDSMCQTASGNANPIPANPDSLIRDPEIAAQVGAARPDSKRTVTPSVDAARRPGPFTVQVAAMSARAGADRIALQLTQAGFDPRVVDLEGSGLLRVRVGAFATEAEASAMAERIRELGFDAVVTNDVARERLHSADADLVRPLHSP